MDALVQAELHHIDFRAAIHQGELHLVGHNLQAMTGAALQSLSVKIGQNGWRGSAWIRRISINAPICIQRHCLNSQNLTLYHSVKPKLPLQQHLCYKQSLSQPIHPPIQ